MNGQYKNIQLMLKIRCVDAHSPPVPGLKAFLDKNLCAMLQRSRQRGVKLSPERRTICATKVSYFGHHIPKDVIKPNPAKIAAVRDMQPPKDKGELEIILGMVNYMAKFPPMLC